MDDPLDLAALEALCAAATEGPWAVDEPWSNDVLGPRYPDGRPHLVCYGSGAADAEFIAAARDAMSKLIARVRELEAVERAALALGEAWDQMREGPRDSGVPFMRVDRAQRDLLAAVRALAAGQAGGREPIKRKDGG